MFLIETRSEGEVAYEQEFDIKTEKISYIFNLFFFQAFLNILKMLFKIFNLIPDESGYQGK